MTESNCPTEPMMNLATLADQSIQANQVQSLATKISHAYSGAQAELLDQVSKYFIDAHDLLESLSAEAAQGSPDNYARHIVYADPQGAFTMMFLVWRPGQFSPVHAHHVWCAYKVLKGTLSEQHFRYDAASDAAVLTGGAERAEGNVVVALPGLEQIHRLGNAGTEVAISLHIYGVGAQNVPAGINHVLDRVLDAGTMN